MRIGQTNVHLGVVPAELQGSALSDDLSSTFRILRLVSKPPVTADAATFPPVAGGSDDRQNPFISFLSVWMSLVKQSVISVRP